MVKEVIHDPIFLASKSELATKEDLQVAQDLYEKKLTTYPRTDARVLSTAVAKEIYKNLNKLKDADAIEDERMNKNGTG